MNKTIFIDRLLLLQILGGKLLLELNRMLRPGGFFVWSATPIYQKLPEDVEIWEGTFYYLCFNMKLKCLFDC